MLFVGGEFAEISDRFSMRQRVVPDESGGRIRQRVTAAIPKPPAG